MVSESCIVALDMLEVGSIRQGGSKILTMVYSMSSRVSSSMQTASRWSINEYDGALVY